MSIILREIQEKDLEIVLEIYNYYILNSTATFHAEKINLRELEGMIPVGHPKYKSYLIEQHQEIAGYCYIGQYKKRQAYDRTAEITIYLKPEFAARGIGGKVIKSLESIAKELHIKVLLAIISGDNHTSINLFEKHGYEKCAHFKQVGEKFHKILDVVAYQKILQ